jgi:hypothetical protein
MGRSPSAVDVAFGKIYAVLGQLDRDYAGDRDALMIVAAERAAVDRASPTSTSFPAQKT